MKEEPLSLDKLFEQEIISEMEEDVMTVFQEGMAIDILADLPIDDDELDSIINDDDIEERKCVK